MTAADPLGTFSFRHHLRATDLDRIEALTRVTGFFSEQEVAIARELAVEALTQWPPSGYAFVLAESAPAAHRPAELLGYTCYGPIPATLSSHDLYWIVVNPDQQRQGIGRKLLTETERLIAALGATKLYADTAGRRQYHATHAFYRAAGYQQEATLRDFYAPGDDKLIFSKTLAPSSALKATAQAKRP